MAARTGVGKTWAMLLIAHSAWKSGYSVLFVTTEMSQRNVTTRLIAIEAAIPYGDFRSGKLSVFDEEKMRKATDAMKESTGFVLVGGDFDFKASSVGAYISEMKPDLAIVDGAYLLRGEGKGRFDQAASVFDELKRVAKQTKTPIVVTTQLNREGAKAKKGAVGTDSLALTDAAGWNSDVIYSLYQDDDMKEDSRLTLKPIKIRESWSGDIECHWDFNKMDFSEVGEGDSDDGFEVFTGGAAESEEDEDVGGEVLF